MRAWLRTRTISVTLMQRMAFVRDAAGRRGNKPGSPGIITLSSSQVGEGTAMSDDSPLLDHARRYFTQAGQARK